LLLPVFILFFVQPTFRSLYFPGIALGAGNTAPLQFKFMEEIAINQIIK
jgi:hypothetical protein